MARIQNRRNTLPHATTTAQDTDAMDEPSSAYFYVGRAEPLYGRAVIVFDAQRCPGTVNTFDTGGLLNGFIKQTSGLPTPEFITADSRDWTGTACQDLDEWIHRAFSGPSAYRDGTAPVEHANPSIDITRESRPASWTWEARTPIDDLRNLKTRCLFIEQQDYEELMAYLEQDLTNSSEERAEVFEEVARLRAQEMVNTDLAASRAANEWMNSE